MDRQPRKYGADELGSHIRKYYALRVLTRMRTCTCTMFASTVASISCNGKQKGFNHAS